MFITCLDFPVGKTICNNQFAFILPHKINRSNLAKKKNVTDSDHAAEFANIIILLKT